MMTALSEHERFLAKAQKRDNGCIEWTASIGPGGYGQFRLARQRKNMLAHRYAWTLANGPIPDGMFVCHHCDNRLCVNPAHLFLGTPADNSADMVRKKRSKGAPRPGRTNPNARLTEIEVEAIRASSASIRALAEAFGVGKSQIHRIRHGLSWS